MATTEAASMALPSAMGSLKGTPNSMMSAPGQRGQLERIISEMASTIHGTGWDWNRCVPPSLG